MLFLYLDLYANLDKPDASNIQTKPKSQKSQKHGIDDRKPLRSTTATIGHEKFGQEGELPKNTKVHTTYSTWNMLSNWCKHGIYQLVLKYHNEFLFRDLSEVKVILFQEPTPIYQMTQL